MSTGASDPSDPGRPTRDRLLDSFEELLKEGGSRAATLDAVAAAADVSKGGLLYHFGSKDALVDGMIERLHEQGSADVEQMRTAAEGPVEYYLRSSVDTGSDFDRALIAVSRIAQERDERGTSAMAQLRADWLAVLREHLSDDSLAMTILLIGDGLYANDASGVAEDGAVEHAREVLTRLGAW